MPTPPPANAYAGMDAAMPGRPGCLEEAETLALQVLVEKRAHQRDLQREIAMRAADTLAELGPLARAADLDLLATFLEVAAVEAERERERWGAVGD